MLFAVASSTAFLFTLRDECVFEIDLNTVICSADFKFSMAVFFFTCFVFGVVFTSYVLERINNSTCVAVEFNSSQDIGFFHDIMLCKQLTVQVFSSCSTEWVCISKV